MGTNVNQDYRTEVDLIDGLLSIAIVAGKLARQLIAVTSQRRSKGDEHVKDEKHCGCSFGN